MHKKIPEVNELRSGIKNTNDERAILRETVK